MDAKETLKYLYEHGHIISGENYKIIKNELNENARLKELVKIKNEFMVCFRLGKRPTEKLWARYEKVRLIDNELNEE